ncbi:hypothetical protein [Thaumasiovibrio sp. DFM-14]|uniref:hypothetical protein n=1 Tax=Thaumasiovibrio sp. DFM-14 TaxID=3384792 RepID=UPI0039A34538
MQNVIKPSTEELDQAIQLEVPPAEQAHFAHAALQGIIKVLAMNPKMYRAYGGYWWPIKRILIEQGHDQFGDTVELAGAAQFGYANPRHTIVAAILYARETAFKAPYSSSHSITLDDGDLVDYTLIDEEMELLINSQ